MKAGVCTDLNTVAANNDNTKDCSVWRADGMNHIDSDWVDWVENCEQDHWRRLVFSANSIRRSVCKQELRKNVAASIHKATL
jgi:hypothetical protein